MDKISGHLSKHWAHPRGEDKIQLFYINKKLRHVFTLPIIVHGYSLLLYDWMLNLLFQEFSVELWEMFYFNNF